MAIKKRYPDKQVEFTLNGNTYWADCYGEEDAAYVFDPKFPDEAAFKLAPINNRTITEIGVIMRKAARFLSGLDQKIAKLEGEGFELINHTAGLKDQRKPPLRKAEAKKEASPNAPPKPKWL